MPIVSAPIVQAPAEDRDRAGVLQQARAEAQSRGPGVGGGVGSGTGTGIGEGNGNGVGPGRAAAPVADRTVRDRASNRRAC